MSYRLFVVVLLISLVLGVSPASAAITPIDPEHPPAPLLEPAELQKLAALRHTYGLYLASEVSPDDTAIVAVGFPEDSFSGMPYLAFLNVNDGSSTPRPLFLEAAAAREYSSAAGHRLIPGSALPQATHRPNPGRMLTHPLTGDARAKWRNGDEEHAR